MGKAVLSKRQISQASCCMFFGFSFPCTHHSHAVWWQQQMSRKATACSSAWRSPVWGAGTKNSDLDCFYSLPWQTFTMPSALVEQQLKPSGSWPDYPPGPPPLYPTAFNLKHKRHLWQEQWKTAGRKAREKANAVQQHLTIHLAPSSIWSTTVWDPPLHTIQKGSQGGNAEMLRVSVPAHPCMESLICP